MNTHSDYTFLITLLVILGLSLALLGLYYVGAWKTYKKLGLEGWKSIIPVYSNWTLGNVLVEKTLAIVWTVLSAVLLLLSCSKDLKTLLVVCAIADLAVSFIVLNELSRAFGHGVGFTLGLIFLPTIFWAILGFGRLEQAKYVRVYELPKEKQTTSDE